VAWFGRRTVIAKSGSSKRTTNPESSSTNFYSMIRFAGESYLNLHQYISPIKIEKLKKTYLMLINEFVNALDALLPSNSNETSYIPGIEFKVTVINTFWYEKFGM